MNTAICVLLSPDVEVGGQIEFQEIRAGSRYKVRVKGRVRGLAPGEHGLHIHQAGDLTEGCASACAHFDPDGTKCHGARSDPAHRRHVGDLGNIVASQRGVAEFEFVDSLIQLRGRRSIVGRCAVVHEGKDDLGRGGDRESLATGNAGARVACGVVGYSKRMFKTPRRA